MLRYRAQNRGNRSRVRHVQWQYLYVRQRSEGPRDFRGGSGRSEDKVTLLGESEGQSCSDPVSRAASNKDGSRARGHRMRE